MLANIVNQVKPHVWAFDFILRIRTVTVKMRKKWSQKLKTVWNRVFQQRNSRKNSNLHPDWNFVARILINLVSCILLGFCGISEKRILRNAKDQKQIKVDRFFTDVG